MEWVKTVKKGTYFALLCALLAIFSLGVWKIVTYYRQGQAAVRLYGELVQKVERPSLAVRVESELEEQVVVEEPAAEPVVLAEYAPLLEENADFVGWLSIDGTQIDYPVVQTPQEPNYYLNYGFDKQYSVYGCPYVQEDCDVFAPSDNVIIYGHNMRDGMMFASLVNYRDEAYWQEHPRLRFDTLYGSYLYEILAVVPTRADESGLAYRQFVNAETEEAFDAYVRRCQQLSCYDTGVTAAYGDHLLTLSTCELRVSDTARLLVVAKRIE